MFSLDMKYYNLNGKLPHITYEYTIPRQSHDITAAEGTATGSSRIYLNLTYNEVNEDVRGDLLRATNCSRGAVMSVRPYNSPPGADVQLQEEEEEVVWEIRTPSPPPPAAMLVYRPAEVTSHLYSHNDNDVEERGPLVPSGYRKSDISLNSNELTFTSFTLVDGVLSLND